MARRKRKLTLEEEIRELELEAENCEGEIKKLTDKKKGLKQLIEQKQMEALHQAVDRSGKSIGEVIAWLNSDSQGEQQAEM